MATIQQIPSPISGKLPTPSVRALEQSNETFTLGHFIKTQSRSDAEDTSGRGSSSFSFGEEGARSERIPISATKDPSLSSRLLRDLLSDEVISELSKSSNSDLVSQLKSFSKSLFVGTGGLANEMSAQQEGATSFQGEVFDALRNLLGQYNDNSIKGAIVSLLKAHAQYSARFDVLQALSSNLQNLSQLVKGNEALSERLSALSQLFQQEDATAMFASLRQSTQALLAEVNKSVLAGEQTRALSSIIIHNLSRFVENADALTSAMDQLLESLPEDADKAALSRLLANLQSSQAQSSTNGSSMPALTRLGEYLGMQANNASYQNLSTQFADILARMKAGDLSGLQALQEMLNTVLVGKDTTFLAARVTRELSYVPDLTTLVNGLNALLRAVPNDALRQSLYDGFMDITALISANGELPGLVSEQGGNSVMYTLASFLAQNANELATSATGMHTYTLLQNLLSAPGVFTPLLHLLLPVEYQDKHAFGELWVDEGGKDNAQEGDYHLFLSFDVEEIGGFELDIYAKEQNLSMTLLAPAEHADFFSQRSGSIAKAVSNAGYTVSNMVVSPLARRRDLTEIFPSVAQRRMGFNVKI